MSDPIESMHQGGGFEEDRSDRVNEGPTTEEGEAESQDVGGEDTGCSTDQDVDVEEPNRSRDQTSSEVEVEDKDVNRPDAFGRAPRLDTNRSFDHDSSLLRTDSSGGSLKDAETRQRVLPPDGRGRIPTHIPGTGPAKVSIDGSPMEVQGSFSCKSNSSSSGFGRPGHETDSRTAASRNPDLSGFNSQFIHDDLERTVEAIRAQQRHFSVVDQVNRSIGQLMSHMTQQVGEASQRMLDAKMNAINDRLNKLAEKYEQIKQLEEQMKESNQILDLLLERR